MMQISSAPNPISPQSVLWILLCCLVVATLLSSTSGAVPISWSSLPRLLWGAPEIGDALLKSVLLYIRLPRVLFSVVAGAALAASGVTMQALFRNPLAEPGLVGISSGAALGAVGAIVLTTGTFLLVATAAFAGSLAATFLAYSVGRRYRGMAGLLLAGIAINTVAGSAIGVVTYLATDSELRDLTFWTMGSLAGTDWHVLGWLGPWTALLLGYLCKQWRVMNALLLGEREAGHLGFEPVSVRRRLIVVTALMIGPLVAVTGGIGFVGLVVPHLMRMVLGAHHRYLLPASMVAGGVLLNLADCLSRILVSPAELPIGLITSLLGGPFFFWLLCRGRSLSS